MQKGGKVVAKLAAIISVVGFLAGAADTAASNCANTYEIKNDNSGLDIKSDIDPLGLTYHNGSHDE